MGDHLRLPTPDSLLPTPYSMIPARRLYFLLLLGLVIAFLLALITNVQVSILTVLFLDGTVLSLAIWDAQRLKANRVQVTRQPLPKLSIGRDNPIGLWVQASTQKAQILIRDSVPASFQLAVPTLQATLAANSRQQLSYTVRPERRGEFEWGEIQVRQLGSWGLAWHDWKIPAREKVAVYPDLVGLRSLTIRLTLESTGTLRQARQLGQGTEFAELREYSRGDDIRAIDWKATARCNRPFVRVLEPEREQTLTILLDRGRLMTAQVQGLKRFDWGLNAALSLALAGLHRGDRVGVGVFDREVVVWIPPERGHHHLSRLIERLSPVQPVLLEPDYVGAVSHLAKQQMRRALVVLITDIIDRTASAELLAAMVKLAPRYLPFCVTLRDPQIDTLAHTATQDFDRAYHRAVAIDLLCERNKAFTQLQQKGVLVLDAPAHQISDRLVERYLHLKTRNLL